MDKKLSKISAVTALLLLSFGANIASAAIIPVAAGSLTECAAVGYAGSCALVYRFNADGSIDTLTDSSVPSTDGIEDTLVGVLNNSGHTIDSLFLNGGALDIFGFDGDGVSPIISSGPGATYFGQYDTVAGPFAGVNTFTPVDAFSGTINFPGLIDGGAGYFVLEEQVSFVNPPTPGGTVPEPTTLALLGAGLFALSRSRRLKLS